MFASTVLKHPAGVVGILVCAVVSCGMGQTVWTPPAPLNCHAQSDNVDDRDPRIAGDTNGNIVAAWRALDPQKTYDYDTDIMTARSGHGGMHWSASVALNSDAETDAGEDTDVQLAMETSGTCIAVWRTDNPIPGYAYASPHIVASRSTDHGTTWSPLFQVSARTPPFDDSAMWPRIAADGQGRWMIAWQQTGASPRPMFSVSLDDGVTWSLPQDVEPASGFFSMYNVTVASLAARNGCWVMSFTTAAGLFTMRYDSAPGTWQQPVHVSPVSPSRPALACDTPGNWIVAWNSWPTSPSPPVTDADILFCRSTDNGTTWTAPAYLNTTALTDGQDTATAVMDTTPRLAPGAGGEWLAVWTSSTLSSYSYVGLFEDCAIACARSHDGGMTWDAPQPLTPRAASLPSGDILPDAAAGTPGQWSVAWQTNDRGMKRSCDNDIAYACSADGGSSWTAPAVLNSYADVDSTFEAEGAASIAAAPDGTRIAVWFAGSLPVGLTDLWMARSTNTGRSWTAPEILHPLPAGRPNGPCFPCIAYGGAVWGTAWQTGDLHRSMVGYIPNNPRNVLFTRSVDNGMTWTAPVQLNRAGEMASLPQIACDGAENWLAVWQTASVIDFKTTESVVVASRSSNGGAGWSEPFLLTAAGAAGFRPSVASLGGGRWGVAWHSAPETAAQSNEPLPDSDIVFTESPDGGANWSSPVAINPDGGRDDNRDYDVRVAGDRARGRWIACWTGAPAGAAARPDADVLVRISGAENWGTTVTVTTPADTAVYYRPHLAVDPAGNAMLTWCSTAGGNEGVSFSTSQDGGTSWTPPARADAPHSSRLAGYDPVTATDGSGRWLMVFGARSTRGLDSDMFHTSACFPGSARAKDWAPYE